MGITWRVDADTRRVAFTWQDPYTFAEWESAMEGVLADPAYEAGYRFLVDRRAATTPTTEFINRMAQFFERHAAAIRNSRAAIVVRDDAGFGMGRMTELTATLKIPTLSVRVFRDPESAARWLESA